MGTIKDYHSWKNLTALSLFFFKRNANGKNRIEFSKIQIIFGKIDVSTTCYFQIKHLPRGVKARFRIKNCILFAKSIFQIFASIKDESKKSIPTALPRVSSVVKTKIKEEFNLINLKCITLYFSYIVHFIYVFVLLQPMPRLSQNLYHLDYNRKI